MSDKILPYLKAYAALIGSICTGLLAVYTGDTEVGKVLTVISIVATTVATFAVPNLDKTGEHADESVQDRADLLEDEYLDGHAGA